MELRQLRYFLSVADARSFVSAANSLYISRQAISKAVAQLESELNVELFMRDSSGAFLTPAGMMFYDRVRAIVMELDNVRSQMQAYGTRFHQRIRLVCSIGSMQLLEGPLVEYREEQQNADIVYQEWPEQECTRMLMEHQADIAITTARVTDPLFATEELLSCPYGVLLKDQPDLEGLETVSIQDLSWIPLAGQGDVQTAELCRRYGIRLQYSGYDYYRLFALTEEGKCAMILPECLIPRKMPDLRWIPLQQKECWHLYKTYSRSVEKNLLYCAALDDLHVNVFRQIGRTVEKETP